MSEPDSSTIAANVELPPVTDKDVWAFAHAWAAKAGATLLDADHQGPATGRHADAIRAGLDAATADLRAELHDLRLLQQLGWERTTEAAARWRAEDPEARANVLPDLGRLVEWLMADADKARADLARAVDLAGRLNKPMAEGLRKAAADTSPNWDGATTVYPPSAVALVALIDHLAALANVGGPDGTSNTEADIVEGSAAARALRDYADREHPACEGLARLVDHGTGEEWDAVCTGCSASWDQDEGGCTERIALLAAAARYDQPDGPGPRTAGTTEPATAGEVEIPIPAKCRTCGGDIRWDPDEPTGQHPHWRHLDQGASYRSAAGAHHAEPVILPAAPNVDLQDAAQLVLDGHLDMAVRSRATWLHANDAWHPDDEPWIDEGPPPRDLASTQPVENPPAGSACCNLHTGTCRPADPCCERCPTTHAGEPCPRCDGTQACAHCGNGL